MRVLRPLALILMTLLLDGCVGTAAQTGAGPEPPADWLDWQAQRRKSVAGTNGWTTLVGLHWLVEGMNTAGSDATNQVVLPPGRAPANVGRFLRSGASVLFEAAPGLDAFADGVRVSRVQLRSDAAEHPTRLQIGRLGITLLERGERLALRVRDPEAATRTAFGGLKYFPYEPSWRLEARFEPLPFSRMVEFEDVTGHQQLMQSPGSVVFGVGGAEHRLQVVEEPGDDEFFIIFRDRTAGTSTYPAGRSLRVPKPDAAGRLVVDFNRAYNPPCAFTAFATCPLPPPQNRLTFAVPAGELDPHPAD